LTENQATLTFWALQSQPGKLSSAILYRTNADDKKQNATTKPTENGGPGSGGENSPEEDCQQYTGGNRRQLYGINDTDWNGAVPYPPLRVDLLRYELVLCHAGGAQ
jgi:hypothetical protein